ncbi:MAG: flagellar motor switch protein FliM [Syntrophobacterales bacterium]|nr:MAG: flagellar motor switch protein FliM [Syntrophobacterales bacterium]
MSNILSQEEVDALLEGMSDGEVKPHTKKVRDSDTSEVRPYDLTSRDRIVNVNLPGLSMSNERFVKRFQTTLSSLLKRVVDLNILSVSMLKYKDFLRTLPIPSSLHIFKMNPLNGEALFVVESQVIFALVDILFGGTGRESYKVEGRDFTSIEINLIKRVVLSALSDLEKGWSSLVDLKAVYSRSEINPQFAQIVAPIDPVFIVKLEMEMEYSSGNMTLCLPYSMLEPIKEKLEMGYTGGAEKVDVGWAQRFRESLKSHEVDIVVELGRTELCGREIINLKEGDVIYLERHFMDGLDIYVEGVPKFKGHPGIYKGNQAVQVSKIL